MNTHELQEKINSVLENLLGEYYDSKGIDSGDITPEQLHKWENLVENMTNLFIELEQWNK